MAFEAASPMDEPWVRQLLILCGLPQEDITPQHLDHFWVMKEEGQIIGVVGLEVLGRSALLRSLAVDPQYRNRSYGTQLIRKAEEYASSLPIAELYLLTMTVERERFFVKRGYRKIERNSAPSAIQKTTEFQGICPVSSVCMVKQLQDRKI